MITQYIEDNKLENQIYVADKPQGISITLSDRFLFDQGQAALKKDAAPTLSKLASLFRNLQMVVSIEGHTDNVPIGANSTYKDNWELSGERALSILRFFWIKKNLIQTTSNMQDTQILVQPEITKLLPDGRKTAGLKLPFFASCSLS